MYRLAGSSPGPFPAQRRRWLYFVTLGFLLLWAIPFPIAIQIPQFGAYEDGIMVATGVLALLTLVVNWRRTTRMQPADAPA